MTNTDNKDPQITAVIQECVEVNMEKLIKLRDDILSEIDGGEECRGRDSQLSDWARTLEEATDQLSAELKQLRAEREGLDLDKLMTTAYNYGVAAGVLKDKADYCFDDDLKQDYLERMGCYRDKFKQLLKSRLTDSAQRGEG